MRKGDAPCGLERPRILQARPRAGLKPGSHGQRPTRRLIPLERVQGNTEGVPGTMVSAQRDVKAASGIQLGSQAPLRGPARGLCSRRYRASWAYRLIKRASRLIEAKARNRRSGCDRCIVVLVIAPPSSMLHNLICRLAKRGCATEVGTSGAQEAGESKLRRLHPLACRSRSISRRPSDQPRSFIRWMRSSHCHGIASLSTPSVSPRSISPSLASVLGPGPRM